MSTWYEVKESTWRPEINAVEVERATESSVYIRGRRNAKSSSYASYFQTWDEAHQYLLAWTQRRILGRYTVDFHCADTSEEVSVFMVKAIDGPAAAVKARQLLSPAFTWTCTAIDRVSDA